MKTRQAILHGEEDNYVGEIQDHLVVEDGHKYYWFHFEDSPEDTWSLQRADLILIVD